MITEINIRNFAIIDQLHLELDSGMIALTGETGAGKSIVIDALELALGQRASPDVIRQQADCADISVVFDIQNNSAAKSYLTEQDLGQDCLIRRVIYSDGRSKSYINGVPVTLQMLRALSEFLINIHGQHEFQTLLKSDKQCELLDNFSKHSDLINQVKTLYQSFREIKNQFEQLDQMNQDTTARIEFLTYQINELDALNLTVEEFQSIDQEYKQLSHADALLNNCQVAIQAIDESDQSSLQTLTQAYEAIQTIAYINPKLKNAVELLNQARIHADEAVNELKQFLDHVDLNPERLKWIEERLTKIDDLSRKHRVKPETLPELHQQMKEELNRLEHKDEHLASLQEKIKLLEKEYNEIANQLTASRKKQAKKLSQLITDNMQHLGMPGGKFTIDFEMLNEPTQNGLDKITFMVSANPGQLLQPLNKVASGGELSRISLAIQVITAQSSRTPTLIFDEVDVGIGGATAEIVGKLLREVGEKTQAICITHLAQVAAKAHHHFRVTKQTQKNMTTVNVSHLDHPERIQELARMTGGVKITKQTLAHAEEML